jgi:hypothetical protein
LRFSPAAFAEESDLSRISSARIRAARGEDSPAPHRYQLVWTSLVAMGVITSALFQVGSPRAFQSRSTPASAETPKETAWNLRRAGGETGRRALQPRSPSSAESAGPDSENR